MHLELLFVNNGIRTHGEKKAVLVTVEINILLIKCITEVRFASSLAHAVLFS